jgi:hypothetical protein
MTAHFLLNAVPLLGSGLCFDCLVLFFLLVDHHHYVYSSVFADGFTPKHSDNATTCLS